MILERMEQDQSNSNDINLDDLKEALLTHICTENKAFFKSQQIDEPELNYQERKRIALEILQKSHPRFLQRFGMNLKQEHLKYFESQTYNSIDQSEVSESIKRIQYNLDHHESIVRNRRFVALKKLIKDNNYFSEGEMMSRDPLLFDELIGQFQSTAEKRANRRPDPSKDTLVDVLLEGIDHDFNREVENKQRAEEENMLQDEDSQQLSEQSQPFNDVHNESSSDSESNHEQWGKFEEPQPGTSSSQPKTKKRPAKLITAGERDLLKDEFLAVMYCNFLSGRDSEFFDYSTVDENEEYDDTLETDQDCEDKYFDEDSQELQEERIRNDSSGSEDELDIYMKHLEKHLKQQENGFQEELDE